MRLSKGVKHEIVEYVDQHSNSAILCDFKVYIEGAELGYAREYSKIFKIKPEKDRLDVLTIAYLSEGEPKVIGEDIQILFGDNVSRKIGANYQIMANYSVNISGKVEYYEPLLPSLSSGLYGGEVVLWFRDSGNPGTWYHPVVGNSEHTHYDVLSEDGSFSFSFNFTGDLTGYDEAIVLVNTGNSAAFMPAPMDGYVSYGGGGYTAYFNESEGLEIPINPAITTISVSDDAEVNSASGRVLRYSKLSQDYVNDLYGSPTFSVTAIPTQIASLSGPCGLFHTSWSPIGGFSNSIEIDPGCTEFTTVSHEYGHWVNYRMWNNGIKFNGASSSLKEGFATFYSFAVRNYAYAAYGDLLLSWDDNLEEYPFVVSPARYYGIRYQQSDVNAAAFASYLWNLYDDLSDPMLADDYDGWDNDDIQGMSVSVFETLRGAPSSPTISNYHSDFKGGVSSSAETSVENIHDFMFDNLYALPSTSMLPSQVVNFTHTILGASQIRFDWESTSYPGSPYFSNVETGYRLYRRSGTSWILVHTISAGTTTYTLNISPVTHDYRITAYNSTGNSLNPREIKLAPPEPSIDGPTYVDPYSIEMFEAHVSGGVPPYSYQWKLQIGGGSWSNVGTNSSVYDHIANPSEDFNLMVEVTDANSNTGYSSIHEVEVGDWILKQAVVTIPDEFSLTQNYPNPFNPTTQVPYGLPETAEVKMSVFDVMGREVRVLVNGQKNAGNHVAAFDAQGLASGTYVLRMRAVGASGEVFMKTLQMSVVK